MATNRKTPPGASARAKAVDHAEGKSVRVRNSRATKDKIAQAALKEFTEKGYGGTSISMVARRAGISKQLLSHHFRTKEDLFREVHDMRFRENVPPDLAFVEPVDVMAERFRARAQDIDYVRFLTWEAASAKDSEVPGRDARLNRIIEKASAIRDMQRQGKIPPTLDHKLMQLAITSLATYPLAFRQITRLITGRDPTDEQFQSAWYRFLQELGRLLFESNSRMRTRNQKK